MRNRILVLKAQRWITIHPDGDESKGRHVLIDDETGKIVGGSIPKDLQGESLKDAFRTHAKALREHPHTAVEKAHHVSAIDAGDSVLRDAGASALQRNLARQLKSNPGMANKLTGAHLKTLDDLQNKLNVYLDRNPDLRDELAGRAAASAGLQAMHTDDKENSDLVNPRGLKTGELKNGELHGYQKKGVNWLLSRKTGVLGHGVGLGKTIQSIAAAMKAMQQPNGPKRFLIIVPSKRLYGWQNEINRFTDMKSVVIDGNPDERRMKYRESSEAQFVIATYGMLQREPDKLHSLCPDGVIIDEAHRLKGEGALQTRNFNYHWRDSEYKFLLTATPMPNNPSELYTMMEHVKPGLLGSQESFEKRFTVKRGRTVLGYKNLDDLRKIVDPYIYMKNRESPDVAIDLPDKHQVPVNLTMHPKQKKLYNDIRDGLAKEIAGMTEEEWRHSSANFLTRLQKLEQVAIDPSMVDPNITDSPKIDWAVEHIQDHIVGGDTRGVVVFSHYKEPIDHIKQKLVDQGFPEDKIGIIRGGISAKESSRVERALNSGEYRVLLATDAAQEGMNLQHGANELIHLDQLWTPAGMEQREGRVHRQGQKMAVSIFSPVMDNSVEERKMDTLKKKQKWIDAVLGGDDIEEASHHLTLDDIKRVLGADL